MAWRVTLTKATISLLQHIHGEDFNLRCSRRGCRKPVTIGMKVSNLVTDRRDLKGFILELRRKMSLSAKPFTLGISSDANALKQKTL